MANTTIKMTIGGKDIEFTPNTTAYNKMINEMMPDNKIAPAHNYLVRIVTPDTKDILLEILKRPGAALAIAAKVNELFIPELEIEVKN